MIFERILVCLLILYCFCAIGTVGVEAQPVSRFAVEVIRPDLLPRFGEMQNIDFSIHGLPMIDWGVAQPGPLAVAGKQAYRSIPQGHWWPQSQRYLRENRRGLWATIMIDMTDWALDRDDKHRVREPARGKIVPGVVRIKPEYIGDWKAYVTHVLTHIPEIKYLQIDSEPENVWISAEGYTEAVKAAYESVQEFNKTHPHRNVKVLVAGFYLGRLTEIPEHIVDRALAHYPNIPPDLAKDQYPNLSPERLRLFAQKLHVVRGFLATGGNYFDVLTLHHDKGKTYDTIDRQVDWYRKRMRAAGYDKPIWMDDMSSNFFPDPQEAQSKEVAKLQRGLERGARNALDHYQEMQSRWLLRKAVGNFAAGIERVSIAYGHDIPSYYMVFWRYMGLFTVEGRAKPAFFTTQLMVEKLDGFQTARRLQGHTYRFTFKNKPDVLVAWSEEGPRSLDLTGHLKGAKVRVTGVPTRLNRDGGPMTGQPQVVSPARIPISENPVFIEVLR